MKNEIHWIKRSTAYMVVLTAILAPAMWFMLVPTVAIFPLFFGFWCAFSLRKLKKDSLTFQVAIPTIAMFGICILFPFALEIIKNQHYHAVVRGDTLGWRIGNWFRWIVYWYGVLWAMMLSVLGGYLAYEASQPNRSGQA